VDTEKILVVDDEEAIREVVSTMLQAKGYDWLSGEQRAGLRRIYVKRITPDLVLSDMIMPEMDGNKIAGTWMRELRSGRARNYGDSDSRYFHGPWEAIRRGAYDYILKPFEKDQLFLGVGRALQTSPGLISENRKLSTETWNSWLKNGRHN